MWTVQEAVLARYENALVLCGSHTVPWKDLVLSVARLKSQGYFEGCITEALMLQERLSHIVLFRALLSFEAQLKTIMELMHSLQMPLIFCGSLATRGLQTQKTR